MTAITSPADLALLQGDAESQMVDTCTITRPDPTNFTGPPLTVYSGKCGVRMNGRAVRGGIEASGEAADEHRCQVDIPVSTTGVKFNDKVTVTASVNPTLVGFNCFVRDVPTVSLTTKLRLICERSIR